MGMGTGERHEGTGESLIERSSVEDDGYTVQFPLCLSSWYEHETRVCIQTYGEHRSNIHPTPLHTFTRLRIGCPLRLPDVFPLTHGHHIPTYPFVFSVAYLDHLSPSTNQTPQLANGKLNNNIQIDPNSRICWESHNSAFTAFTRRVGCLHRQSHPGGLCESFIDAPIPSSLAFCVSVSISSS